MDDTTPTSPTSPDGPLIDDITRVPTPPQQPGIIVIDNSFPLGRNGNGDESRWGNPQVVRIVQSEGSRRRRSRTRSSSSSSVTRSGSGSGSADGADNEPLGMRMSVKLLYKDDINRHTWWTDKMPKIQDKSTAKYAIVVRNVFNDGDDPGDSKIKIHSVVVQSPLLRKVLRDLLEGYPGIALKGEKITFTVPFAPLVHRWTAVQRALEFEVDEQTKEHLKLFVDTVEPALKESLAAKEDFIENREIAFQHLWTVCQPKDVIWSMVDKADCAFQLKRAEYVQVQGGRKLLLMHCTFIEWDGSKFGKATKSVLVPEYSGVEKVAELTAFPIRYHPDENIQDRLRERGKKFEELRGYHYLAYEGVAINTLGIQPEPKHVEGRIVIDSKTYFSVNASEEVSVTALDTDGDGNDDASSDDSYERFEDPSRPRMWHGNRRRRWRSRDSSLERVDEMGMPPIEEMHLTPDQHLICSSQLRGFSLTLKEWLNFQVSNIRPITWNSSAFTNLVLPAGYKKLILAFANSQRLSNQTFDDVISGKGKGIIMLLNGPPGVGKTLTAESVAETMKVPLYCISAGDLGIDPRTVEVKLLAVFKLAKAWNAVILLDEADIFLEKRRLEDLLRNELVSIFLQNLEYFQSTLFLTTNRVETFDPAFESRIHISITYPPLDSSSRKKVWTNFLARLGKREIAGGATPTVSPATGATNDSGTAGDSQVITESSAAVSAAPAAETASRPIHEISEENLEELSKEEVNGRQIKNIIKAAELLALEDKEPLKIGHLKTVLGIMRGTLGA